MNTKICGYNSNLGFGRRPLIPISTKIIGRKAPAKIEDNFSKTIDNLVGDSIENSHLSSTQEINLDGGIRDSFAKNIIPLLEKSKLSCQELAAKLKAAL